MARSAFRRRSPGVTAAAAVAATLASLGAAQPPEPAPSFRTSVDVIRLDALVLDEGRPVTDLAPRDFEVFDNGVRQVIQVEHLADATIDVVLALDTSSSVSGPLLTRLIAAAAALVDALDARDRAALLTFSHALAVRAPLASERSRVRDALRAVTAAGSTSVIDALSAAISLPGASGRPTLLLVFSDGLDTASFQSAAQVLDQARRSDMVIDGVVVGNESRPGSMALLRSGNEADDPAYFLQRVTAATGGRLLDGSRGERLSNDFVEALRSFRQRYEITYSPQGPPTPGWHAIEVRIKRRGNLTVRARPGYLR